MVACRPDGTSWTAPNDAAGITAPVDRVRALVPSLIVLEATDGDATPRVAALAVAGLPVVVANPRHVRDFATATGPLATTDRLDAQLPFRALCGPVAMAVTLEPEGGVLAPTGDNYLVGFVN